MKILAYYRAIKAFVRLTYLKLFSGIKRINYSYRNHFGSNVSMYFDNGSVVHLGSDIGLSNNVCLSCREGAELYIGNNTFFNNGCMLVAHERIIIEKNVKVGPYTCFFDHDYDYKSSAGLSSKVFKTAPIVVGEGTWIGAGCIILRGTNIGKNCVIAAGSVIKGCIKDNTVHINNQKGIKNCKEVAALAQKN